MFVIKPCRPNSRFPFNWRTPVGYSVAFFIQYAVVLQYARVGTCVATFIAGAFWLMISLAKDLKRDLLRVNYIIRDDRSLSKAMDGFAGLIELHINAKQLGFRKISRCKKID